MTRRRSSGNVRTLPRLAEAVSAVGPATLKIESLEVSVESMVAKQARLRTDLGERRERRRVLKRHATRVIERLRLLDDFEKLGIARQELQRSEELEQGVDAIKRYLGENPVPEEHALRALKATHEKTLQLRANRDAASMTLSIEPVEGAEPARLSVDGRSPRPLAPPPLENSHSASRKAELHIPDWGRVELSRGSGGDDLDHIEADLRRCREELTVALAAIGIDPNNSDAFDRLLRRNAVHGLKVEELRKRERDLRALAPKGLDPLRRRIFEIEAKLKDAAEPYAEDSVPLPDARDELEERRADLCACPRFESSHNETLAGAIGRSLPALDAANSPGAR